MAPSASNLDVEPPTIRKILIAEDSAVIQDLLKLMLTGRGHEVIFCEDGLSALNHLLEDNYDVALLDFGLPVLTGLEAARKLFEEREGKSVPRLLAMTSDPEGFLDHEDAGELFELILPKPIDLDKVVEHLEDLESIAKPRLRKRKNRRGDGSKHFRAYANLERFLLYFPLDFHGDPKNRSVSARINLYGPPNALVITNFNSENELDDIFSIPQTQTTPIIDLTGKLDKRADLAKQKDIPLDRDVLDMISRFEDRRSRVFPDFLTSKEQDIHLLLRIYTSGGDLNLGYDGGHIGGVVYNTLLSPDRVQEHANNLVSRGLLTRKFFDRVHSCKNCKSSRLSPREECVKCGSTHLTETQYLHHFRCAYQGSEREFHMGRDLVCPKCRNKLRHFGQDYDKPGNMLVCEECDFTNNDANIGFICFDCGVHNSAEITPIRDVFTYELTEDAVQFITKVSGEDARLAKSLSFANLPLELVANVNKCAKDFLETGAEFHLVDLHYNNYHILERDHGTRMADLAHEHIFQKLCQDVPDIQSSSQGLMDDYFLFQNHKKEELESALNSAVENAMKDSTLSFKYSLRLFGPNELY